MALSANWSTLAACSPSRIARARRREIASIIVQRAEALPETERALLLAVFAEGRSVLSIVRRRDPDPATLIQRAASCRRLVRRLVRRVMDPTFELVRTRAHTWPQILARVARARFLHGLTIRHTATQQRLTVHTVRTLSASIRTMAATPTIPSREAAA